MERIDNYEDITSDYKESMFPSNIHKEKSSTWKELSVRWKSESPDFWKKMLKIAIAIGSSAAAVIGADQVFNLQAYGVDQIVFTIAGYVVAVCAALGLSAKITKE